FLQREPAFMEIAIRDKEGQERLRISRLLTITEQDLSNKQVPVFLQHLQPREVFWGPVITTDTSEPWIALATPLERSETAIVGMVLGTLNLKALWDITTELKLSHGGRAYVVDQSGGLIAADDPNLVRQHLSFADRPLVQEVTRTRDPKDTSFVRGEYRNEHGMRVIATGLLIPKTRWAIVLDQPRALLYADIWRTVWFFAGLSCVGLLLSLSLASMLSRRLTAPLIPLRT